MSKNEKLTTYDGTYVAIGLMSGTSLDGVDAALIWTDGHKIFEAGPAITHPYPDKFRKRMHAILGRSDVHAPDIQNLTKELNKHHVDAIVALMSKASDDWQNVDVVGYHGQTLHHAPDQGVTIQVGDGKALAKTLEVPVVSQFRVDDVGAGGQGAPLVPIYHQALLQACEDRPDGAIAILNLGGVGNITLAKSDGTLLAFDTGPGNALIDDWVYSHTGQRCDLDGVLAAQGRKDEAWIAQALSDPYFLQIPPKSLDRNDFPTLEKGQMTLTDGAATLTAFTVGSVVAALDVLPETPVQWVVCGGGRKNLTLMSGLEEALAVPVVNADMLGWDGDALEAQAFGFLAVRSVLGLPITFPDTTGVPEAQKGGHLDFP